MKDTTGKYRLLGIYLLLAGITFVVYEPVMHHQFVNFDDDSYVTENQYVKAGLTCQSIFWAFTAPRVAFWHPLTMLSHMLDCELFDLKPAGHHLTNLLLHIANALLLFYVLKDMTGAVWKSWLVAALFALHPLHVESVAWVAERKDVLSTLFWMLTLAGYLWYVRRPGTARYLVTLFVFVLGLMAKPMLVTLPFVLLLLDYWPLGRFENISNIRDKGQRVFYRLVLEKVPFIVLSAVSSIVAFFVQKDAGAVRTLSELSLYYRIVNVPISYLKYIEKMFWPSRLAVFYPHEGGKVPISHAVFVGFLLLCVSIGIIYLTRSRKYLFLGWFWYLGTLVPVIGLVQVGGFAMADRYTYVPLTGLFIIIVWGTDELLTGWRWRKITLGVSAPAVLLALSICTGFQLRYWKNSIALFEHALKVTNKNSVVYSNLGMAYGQVGRYQQALENCKQAVKIRPDVARIHRNLGAVYGNLGRYQEEIEACRKAIKIDPDYAEAYVDLGTAHGYLGRYQEAIDYYKRAIKIKPDVAETQRNLGVAYGYLGRYQEEIEACRKAIKIDPDYAEAYIDLGAAHGNLGRYQEAIDDYKRAIKIKPDAADAYYNLGVVYDKLDRHQEAIDDYKRAIKIKPDIVEAHYNLGVVYDKLGRYQEAIEAFEQAIRIKPDYVKAYDSIGVAYIELGRYNEAVETLKQTVKIKPDYAEAHCNLGVAYSQLSRWQDAIEASKQAIKIKPDYAEAHYNLGIAYLTAGDKTSASEQYKILKLLDTKRADKLFSRIYK